MYDLIIIGLGPAGLTAGIYASRYKLKNLIIGETLGGEFALAHKVGNLPGILETSGFEWAEKAKEQVERLGGEMRGIRVIRVIRGQTGEFLVKTADGKEYQAKALIVATGSERRKLGVAGEKEYLGKGVSYCTTCDAAFFKGKTVAIVGGSDAAVSGAIHLAEYAEKVYLIYRGEALRAEPTWLEAWKKIEAEGRGETIYQTNVVRILGLQDVKNFQFPCLAGRRAISNFQINSKFQNPKSEKNESDRVMAVELDKPYKNEKDLAVEGVFIEIGGVPGTALLQSLEVELTDDGHVKVGEGMKTKVAGLFAAGDMTEKSVLLAQAITAMCQGALAAASAYRYLKGGKAPRILGV